MRLHVPIKLVLGLPWPKRSGVVLCHSSPYIAEVKNEWSYTSTHSICLHGVDKETLAFNLFKMKPSSAYYYLVYLFQLLYMFNNNNNNNNNYYY